ncbi:MAG: hypothetical protein KAT77_00725 [Nanoarchaeota archaeon]|nr:hypothetical protein [Nanoarchaeota archaeon]
MIKLNKKTFNILWTSGIVATIIAVFILGFVVTIFDSNINEKEEELNNLRYDRETRIMGNLPEYHFYNLDRDIARLTYIFMESNNYPKDYIDAAHDEYLEAQRDALAKLYTILYGGIPSRKLVDSWEKMNIVQLQNMGKEWQEDENFQDLSGKILSKKKELINLEDTKNNLIKWAIIIQVIGLVLINIAEYCKKNQ